MEKLIWKDVKKPEVRIGVNGFSVEGKTSFMYRIKLADVRTTIPRFDVDLENEKKKDIMVMEISRSGRDMGRVFLQHAMERSDAVIFIADSSDMDRLMEAKDEFNNYEYSDPIFAIAMNKHDLEGAMSISQVQDTFDVQKLRKKHTCEVFKVSTATGEGIPEIMEWVWQTLKESKNVQKQKKRSGIMSNLKAPGQFIKRLFTKI